MYLINFTLQIQNENVFQQIKVVFFSHCESQFVMYETKFGLSTLTINTSTFHHIFKKLFETALTVKNAREEQQQNRFVNKQEKTLFIQTDHVLTFLSCRLKTLCSFLTRLTLIKNKKEFVCYHSRNLYSSLSVVNHSKMVK